MEVKLLIKNARDNFPSTGCIGKSNINLQG